MATYSTPQTAEPIPGFVSKLIFRHWGFLMLRGIAALLFGVLALSMPGLTLVTLVLLFGTYAIVDGLIAIAAAVVEQGIQHRWWLGLLGVMSVIVGVVTFRAPGLTGLLLLYYIAAWAVLGGALQIFGAVAVRKIIKGEWLLIAAGVVSVLFGIALFVRPGAGALAFITAIGLYAIIAGVLLMLFSLRMRSFAHHIRSELPRAQRVA